MPGWQDIEQSIDELRLLSEAQKGDTEAFGQLYEHYSPVVFRFIYAHIDNRMDAEDLTEEAFLRVMRSLPKFRQQGVPFAAFLFRIARNALIDYYRRSKHADQQVSVEDHVLTDWRPEPGEMVLADQERQEIRRLLGELREDYREVLILRFLSELSPDETAQVMGKSSGAVRVLQHRALAALRSLLDSSKE